MKKILLAAAAALAVISCGNKGGVEIAPARQESNAGVIKVTGKPVEASLKSGVKIQIQKIEFMREGEYVGQGVEVAKATGDTHYFSGTFTKVGDDFQLGGDFSGKINVNGNKITFSLTGEEPTTTDGGFTQTPPPTDPTEQALFVNWKISMLEVIIDKPSVKHKFTGADASNLGAIAKYINDNQSEVKLDLDLFNQYVISTISLSQAPEKTIKVSFADPKVEPIVGTWSGLNLTQQSFTYKLDAQLDGQLFTAEASGSFAFSNDYKTVTITLNVKSDDMNGKISITANKA